MLLSGMSMIVVTPPAAAALVAVVKPSHSVRPGSFTWTCESTRPGSQHLVVGELHIVRGLKVGVVRRDRDDPPVADTHRTGRLPRGAHHPASPDQKVQRAHAMPLSLAVIVGRSARDPLPSRSQQRRIGFGNAPPDVRLQICQRVRRSHTSRPQLLRLEPVHATHRDHRDPEGCEDSGQCVRAGSSRCCGSGSSGCSGVTPATSDTADRLGAPDARADAAAAATPATALPCSVCSSSAPSPVITRSAPTRCSWKPTSSNTNSIPGRSSAPRSASAAKPTPPAAPAPGASRRSRPVSRATRSAHRVSAASSSSTCRGSAPFCGP